MKCHWCEKETDNKTEIFLNGDFEIVEVPFCDSCKEAEKQANEMINQPDSSKREDSWKDRSMTNSQYEEFVKMTNKYMRCGTRNNQETD